MEGWWRGGGVVEGWRGLSMKEESEPTNSKRGEGGGGEDGGRLISALGANSSRDSTGYHTSHSRAL